MGDNEDRSIYEGLNALAATSFPKRCRRCGRIYHSVEDFIAETRYVSQKNSGLKPSQTEDGTMTLELFRNCPCGATLMDVFNNRRDISENGIKRRNNFDKLMATAAKKYNIDKQTARTELLKIMNGEKSEIIKHIIPAHSNTEDLQ